MTIQLVGWRLDTCSCYIVEQYDDTDPTYTKTLYEVRNKCAAHIDIPDELLYGVVREENSTWAIAFQGLLDNASSTVYELDEWGNKNLKQTVYVSYSWTGTAPIRVLNITITGASLTTNQKKNIQTFFDTKFGVGHVLII